MSPFCPAFHSYNPTPEGNVVGTFFLSIGMRSLQEDHSHRHSADRLSNSAFVRKRFGTPFRTSRKAHTMPGASWSEDLACRASRRQGQSR